MLPAAAVAADVPATGSPAGLQACALITADAARLACYDTLARRDAPAPAVPEMPAPASSAAVAAPATAGGSSPRSFGLYAAEHPPPPPAAKSLEARIVELGTSAGGHMTVTLEGGQLWELFDADPLLAVGDAVTISRATLGSFMLQTPSKRLHRARRLR